MNFNFMALERQVKSGEITIINSGATLRAVMALRSNTERVSISNMSNILARLCYFFLGCRASPAGYRLGGSLT